MSAQEVAQSVSYTFTGIVRPDLPLGSPERDAFFAETRKTFAEDWEAARQAVERDRRNTSGDLYFIRVGEFLKIGRTRNLKARLGHIKCHAPTPPVLVGSLPGKGWQEKEWHRAFRHLRTHGEWFAITPELSAAIDAAMT